MGRVTEFIHYINEEYEPDAIVKKADYYCISFTEKITKIAKSYRKERRKEKRINEQ